MWLPGYYNPIDVSFAGLTQVKEKPESDNVLVLYSGGVDSTYNLIERSQQGKKQALLTLQGLDYKTNDDDKFKRLCEKTKAFTDSLSSKQHYLKTDAYKAYKQFNIDGGLGHGFVLAASLFMYEEKFQHGEISADYSSEQEFIVHPWGTNSISNAYFKGARYFMNTASLNISRANKIKALSESHEALSSLSFCIDYKSRPDNCGVCSKCTRTKAMFLAAIGKIPNIFTDTSVNKNMLETISITERNEIAFFMDLYQMAEFSNHLHLIPNIESLMAVIVKKGEKKKPSKNKIRKWLSFK